MKQKKTILIGAGGTGGHIMPALSIAESLKAKNPAINIEFVHGPSLLEKDIYSKIPFPSHVLSVGRLRHNVSKKERIKTFFSLPFVLLKALKLIIKTKPVLVLGTGGAISGPVLLAGLLLRKTTVLFEPNAIPGLTNRWLFPFVKSALLVFPSAQKHFKKKFFSPVIKIVPFPVRASIARIPVKEKPHYPLRVLILGGSQGAQVINKVAKQLITKQNTTPLEATNSAFSFVHQTGRKDFEHCKKAYTHIKKAEAFSFLHNIQKFYAWADIVIGRAGAGFLAELSAIGRAGILIPLAHSADQHQLKNAHFLKKNSSAILIEEQVFSLNSLKKALQGLSQEPNKIKRLACRLHRMKLGAKADSIASYLLSLIF